MIQLKDYNCHLKALERIKNKPSEYKDYTKPRHFENVIKKNKILATTFDKREWNNALESKNVWLLGNISKIKSGDYKTCITRNDQALSYKLKSLRKESTNKEHHRIALENTKIQTSKYSIKLIAHHHYQDHDLLIIIISQLIYQAQLIVLFD